MDRFFGFARELLERGLAVEKDSYGDASRFYDLTIQEERDIPFYLALARESAGHILDMGCGTGRVLLPLLEAGFNVEGVDQSASMIALARQKIGAAGFQAPLHIADIRQLHLGRLFDLVIIPYYTFIYMHTDPMRLDVLTSANRHLVAGGLLAFDFDAGSGEPGLSRPWLGVQRILEPDGTVVLRTAQMNTVHEHLRVVNQITYTLGPAGSGIEVDSSMEASIPSAAMTALLQASGFTVRGLFCDYQGSPYQGGEECIVVAVKEQSAE